MYLSIADKVALVVAYKKFLYTGTNIQDYKEYYDYKGIDHLMALELGSILNLTIGQESLEVLEKKLEQF